jgi:hypothetical protein
MRALVMTLLIAACGTGGDAGGGAQHLPVSGGGPFGVIASQEGDLIDAPVVLTDPVDLDDPVVFADGAQLAVWVTAHRNGGDTIEHADAVSLRQGFADLELALAADEPWEGGGISAPSLIRGNPWLLFYRGAGGIGVATSADAHSWSKLPGPVIPGAAPPAAVRLADKIRVYYPKNGGIWAAEAASETGPFTEIGEMVRAVPYGVSLGRVFARAEQTPAGRVRHDLYFTVNAVDEDGVPFTTCGFAASYDGRNFEVFPTSITDIKLVTRGPTMTPYQSDGVDSALLLFIQRRGARDVVMAGKSP